MTSAAIFMLAIMTFLGLIVVSKSIDDLVVEVRRARQRDISK